MIRSFDGNEGRALDIGSVASCGLAGVFNSLRQDAICDPMLVPGIQDPLLNALSSDVKQRISRSIRKLATRTIASSLIR